MMSPLSPPDPGTPASRCVSALCRRGWLKSVAMAAAGGATAVAGGTAVQAAQRGAVTRSPRADALEDLLAKQAITEVIYRYSRGIDRMDKDLCNSIWNRGATADFPNAKGTGPEIIDSVFKIHATLLSHSHQMTNILIKISGDTAVSETYGMVSLYARLADDKTRTTLIRNRYLDRWSRHNGMWGIDHRTLVVDFRSDVEATGPVPTSTARRDTSDPSYAIFGR
jgi:hypothetical protein